MSPQDLEALVAVVDTHSTYLISSCARCQLPAWHTETILIFQNCSQPQDSLQTLLVNLVGATLNSSTKTLAAVALRRVLSCLFEYSDAGLKDFESWLAFCRQNERSNLVLCSAILYSLNPYLIGTVKYQQYQNFLAGSLTDTSSSKANTDGLRLVRLLIATAPSPESVHVFLPQQRVLFLLQTLVGWLTSEEDVCLSLNEQILGLLLHLIPVIQTVHTSNWDRIMDLVVVNLEDISWDDGETGVAFWYSCRILKLVQGLLKRNHSLQVQIGTQVQTCIKLMLSWFVAAPPREKMSRATGLVADVVEDIIRDSSALSLYPQIPVESTVGAIFTASTPTSCLAFNIAQAAIRRLTDTFAIEAELAPETTAIPLISAALLNRLIQSSPGHQRVTLIGWLLLFSYFENASSRLRNSYNCQLRDTNVVAEKFLPLVFEILNVTDRGKPQDVSIWDVTSYNLSTIDESGWNPMALAAHLYYVALRTIPSHIRSWWEGCRNKQLSMNVAVFTNRYFSPILIHHELGTLREPAVVSSLSDGDMSIRVSTVAKEVKVSYVVDEESMEIVIRIPGDYPLQSVDVLDVRKVGVPESTWRAWLLVLQQTITSHNGTISEALGLFKKNISLHFEGVEACAICYAIISVVDRSLPNKACRTCHNRFHPSCLYKWFSTSHSSSCPLCRSLF